MPAGHHLFTAPKGVSEMQMYPWNDYSGRLSPLKLVVFVSLFVPASWVAVAYFFDLLGARPLNEAIHQIGLWTIRLIFLALAITPLRQILHMPRLIIVRRMIGIAAFIYVMIHFGLYATDQAFDLGKVAHEIVMRVYLTIGFAALLGLAALAATSTDAMIRRLGGRRWRRLHQFVYLIGILAVIHYCFQSKLDLWEPTIMAGLLFWLLAYRLLTRLVGVRGRFAEPMGRRTERCSDTGHRGRGGDLFQARRRGRSDAGAASGFVARGWDPAGSDCAGGGDRRRGGRCNSRDADRTREATRRRLI